MAWNTVRRRNDKLSKDIFNVRSFDNPHFIVRVPYILPMFTRVSALSRFPPLFGVFIRLSRKNVAHFNASDSRWNGNETRQNRKNKCIPVLSVAFVCEQFYSCGEILN